MTPKKKIGEVQPTVDVSMSLIAFRSTQRERQSLLQLDTNRRRVAAITAVAAAAYLAPVHMPCGPIVPTVDQFACPRPVRHELHIEYEAPLPTGNISLGAVFVTTSGTGVSVSTSTSTGTVSPVYL